MRDQPSTAKYKIKKDDCFYIIYDVSGMYNMRIIGTAYTFLGAKRKMKKYAKRKKEKPVEYYFTENGVLINE